MAQYLIDPLSCQIIHPFCITTSYFGAEAELSYIFWEKTFLRCSFTWYTVFQYSGHDQMTLMVWKLFWNELLIRTADYYKLRCVSCNKKTIVNVIQNMPLTTLVNLHFLLPLFCPYR